MNVHFSSATDLWSTPQTTFDELNAEFGFETDVCALPENAKCDRFYTPKQDGLAQHWQGSCFMNPSYGDPEFPCRANCKKKRCQKRGHHSTLYTPGIIDWMRKAYESSQMGATVVCLVPARTDTRWWHEYAMRGEIRFIRGRLQFGSVRKDAPFPCAVVVFRPQAIACAA